MNFFLDYHSRMPIYEQIKDQIISLVGQGSLKADDQLPSLRQLSAELSVNINTIKRAFSELEAQGIVYSVAGKGIFISESAQRSAIVKKALADVRSAVLKAKTMGAEKDEITALINNIYKGDETDD